MLNFLRNSLREFVFSTPKSKTSVELKTVPTIWGKIPNEENFWRKALDDEETSVKGVYFKYIVNTETPIHYHDYIEHIIVLEGKIVVETKKQSFTLTPGDDLTIPAGMSHFLKIDKDSKYLSIWHPVMDNTLTESYPV